MIRVEDNGILQFVAKITGGEATRPATAKPTSSAEGSFSQILKSELNAKSGEKQAGTVGSSSHPGTAAPMKKAKALSANTVRQLINDPIPVTRSEKPAGTQTATTVPAGIIPGIVQIPIQTSQAPTSVAQNSSKPAVIDIAKIVNFNTPDSKVISVPEAIKALADNSVEVIGGKSKAIASDWEKYHMESGSRKGSSIFNGGMMISFRLPL